MPSLRPAVKSVNTSHDAAAASYEYKGFPAEVIERLPLCRAADPKKILAKLKEHDVPYTGLGRKKFCMLCLALIEHGISPGLLGLRSSVNRPTNLSPEQMDESNDRQVLDLYWLFLHRKAAVIPKDSDFRGLFEAEKFDFDWASQLIARKGLVTYKVKKLTLYQGLEIELMVLRTSATRVLLETQRHRSNQLEKFLSARAGKPGSKIDRADIPKYLMEFKCLDLGEGSPVRSAQLWSMMTGEPVTPQLKERLRNRKRWLTGDLGMQLLATPRKAREISGAKEGG